MKKILLTTTALVGFVASSAMADGPTITLGGGVDFQAGFSKQKRDYKIDDVTEASTKFATNSDISVKAEGTTDYGLKYGGVIKLAGDNVHSRTDASDNQLGDQLYVKQAFVFVESNFGRMEAGSQESVTFQTEVGPGTFGRGTGGVTGDWDYYVDSNTAIYSTAGVNDAKVAANYATRAHLAFDSKETRHANKVNYFTPVMSGFQGAVGFTPQTNQMGTAKGFNNIHTNPGDVARNLVNVALSYHNKFDQIGVAANAGGAFGKAVEPRNPTDVQKRNDLRAYNLGLALSYAGFTLGGNYSNSGKSLTLKTEDGEGRRKNNFYTLGLDYENGPFGAMVAWMAGKSNDNKSGVISVAADYNLAPGFTPYIEGNFFKLTPKQNADATKTAIIQKGNVVIIGTKFNF
jgi:outer membrane protein OmpU